MGTNVAAWLGTTWLHSVPSKEVAVTDVGFTLLTFLPALILLGFLIFIAATFHRLVRAAEGAREALRDLADRFPKMS